MNRTLTALTSLLLAVSAQQAGAQVPPPPTLPAGPAATAPATRPATANAAQPAAPKAAKLPESPESSDAPDTAEARQARAGTPEPRVLREVTEDDNVRIEELRVRGQTRKITVQPKIAGMSAYDIIPSEPGRAPERDPKAGQRVWLSLSF